MLLFFFFLKIFKINIINNKYFISFKDSRGEYNNVEISKEIYELFDYYETEKGEDYEL